MMLITIRKPCLSTPSYYKLTNVFNPPHITIDDIMNYYNIIHTFYIQDDELDINNDEMVIDSDKSNENNIMNVDIYENNNHTQEKLKQIYYRINSVQNGFPLNFGDIIEFPDNTMYFYHIPCIRIN